MSAGYTSILWNNEKKKYDRGILLFVLCYLVAFYVLHALLHPLATFETLLIRAFGILAFFLLHVILVIGPLCRLNPSFLPILYNRRHLGVSMFLIALIHGGFSIVQFHTLGNTNPIRSIFLSNTSYLSLSQFPFQVLGFLALIILGVMAATSHDFWLKNLGIKVWKTLHMFVYVAYGLLILHVVLGSIQNEKSPIFFGVVVIGFIGVASIHLIAGFKEKQIDEEKPIVDKDFVRVCPPSEIEEDRAVIVSCQERIAVFKYGNKVSATSNVCKHQGGPLGEGQVVDGCITCPWHGYQYLPESGQSPPPFQEKISTYDVKLEDGYIWVNRFANPEGTPTEPLILKENE